MVRPVLLLGLGCTVVLTAWTLRAEPTAPAPSTTPTSTPATTPTSADDDDKLSRIKDLQEYYAKTYGQPLTEKNRLTQLIGVMSLSRVDGAPLNKKLIGAMSNTDVLVGQLAWEALHARHESLSDAECTAWIAGGMDIAKRGGFPGSTIAPLLAAAMQRPAASLKMLPEILMQVADQNDPALPEGKAASDAAQEAVAVWHDPKLVQVLISRITMKPALAARIARMLQTLPGAPAPTNDPATLKGTWNKFSREAKLAAPTTLPTYAGTSALFPKPDLITDPDDTKWRRELELGDLKLDSVEIAFCIDATGSMEKSNEFVTSYTETVVRLLRLMSDQVRAGTVYYRHEIDPAIQLECCKTVPDRSFDFYARALPLTNDPTALVQQMRAQKPIKKNGHFGDGAYAAGISTAMKSLQWSPKGKHIIACTGDAPITPGSDQAMVALARKAKDDGYLLLFLARDPRAAAGVAPASRAATGLEPIIYKPDIDKLAKEKPAAVGTDSGVTATASDVAIESFHGTAFEAMTARVLELSLPDDYRNRVKPLLDAVLPILQAQDAAARSSASLTHPK